MEEDVKTPATGAPLTRRSDRILLWILLIGLLLAYLEVLVSYWVSGPSYAMASLIALIGAAMAFWRERPRIVAGTSRHTGLAIAAVGVVVLCYTLGLVFAKQSLAGAFAIGLVVCICYMEVGWPGIRRLGFPLVLLAFVPPLPEQLAAIANSLLVGFATSLGVTTLGWLVEGVERSGSMIVLPGHGAIEVISDCSGLDGVALFLPIALILLYSHPELRFAVRCAIVILAVPLALFGNLVRLFVTGLLQAHDFSITWWETFHQVIGFCTLGLALVTLLLMPKLLHRRQPGVAK